MPVLVLRESGLRQNIDGMAAYCAAAGVDLAPHGKTPMAPQLMARQLAAGAWAVTAATAGHMRVYRSFGIPRILLANELTDRAGLAWLAFHVAHDYGLRFAGSSFGSRQVLYERFFASDPLTRARALNALYPKEDVMRRVREFLDEEPT